MSASKDFTISMFEPSSLRIQDLDEILGVY
jgi:hypothetical protein